MQDGSEAEPYRGELLATDVLKKSYFHKKYLQDQLTEYIDLKARINPKFNAELEKFASTNLKMYKKNITAKLNNASTNLKSETGNEYWQARRKKYSELLELSDDKLKEKIKSKYYKALPYSADLLTIDEIKNFTKKTFEEISNSKTGKALGYKGTPSLVYDGAPPLSKGSEEKYTHQINIEGPQKKFMQNLYDHTAGLTHINYSSAKLALKHPLFVYTNNSSTHLTPYEMFNNYPQVQGQVSINEKKYALIKDGLFKIKSSSVHEDAHRYQHQYLDYLEYLKNSKNGKRPDANILEELKRTRKLTNYQNFVNTNNRAKQSLRYKSFNDKSNYPIDLTNYSNAVNNKENKYILSLAPPVDFLYRKKSIWGNIVDEDATLERSNITNYSMPTEGKYEAEQREPRRYGYNLSTNGYPKYLTYLEGKEEVIKSSDNFFQDKNSLEAQEARKGWETYLKKVPQCNEEQFWDKCARNIDYKALPNNIQQTRASNKKPLISDLDIYLPEIPAISSGSIPNISQGGFNKYTKNTPAPIISGFNKYTKNKPAPRSPDASKKSYTIKRSKSLT